MEDKKKYYKYMENTLQSINKNYISLPDDEVKRNNQVLENVSFSFIKLSVSLCNID